MNRMKENNKIARIVGALFIITMLAGMIDANLAAPILNGTLDQIYTNKMIVKVGAFFALIMSVGIVGISVVLFPLLYEYNKSIAITYVSFRTMEGVLLIIMVICSMLLLLLSQEYIIAGIPNESYYQNIATLVIKVKYLAYQIAMVILGFGSLFLCYLFYKTKLIPQWLSIWGLIGYVLLFASGLLDIAGIIDTVNGKGILMYIPGGLWELIVFPIWLFLKGFKSTQ